MFDWNRIRLIAAREIKTRTATKSYRYSMLAQMVIVALIALSPVLIAKFTDRDTGPEHIVVAVVDEANVQAKQSLSASLPLVGKDMDATFELVDAATAEGARNQVDSGKADAAFIVVEKNDALEFTIVTTSGDPNSTTAQVLVGVANSIEIARQIDASGLSASQVQQVFAPPSISNSAADETEKSTDDTGVEKIVNFVIAYASTIIIFIFVVLYGQWIAQGVVEEKANRIMEIMVNAATPRDLLAGKVIGIMATALVQFAPLALIVGLIASFQKQIGRLFGVPQDKLFNVDFGVIAWSSMGWFLLYFVLGFLLYGALYAGIGSLVSRQEEVATAVAPMTMVMMIGYFAALASMSNPDGIVARVAYLFPGTSVFVAMLRLINGNPQPWEIAVSIIGLVIAIVLAILLAARLYRVGVLMYGQAPKFTQIFKLGGMQQVSR